MWFRRFLCLYFAQKRTERERERERRRKNLSFEVGGLKLSLTNKTPLKRACRWAARGLWPVDQHVGGCYTHGAPSHPILVSCVSTGTVRSRWNALKTTNWAQNHMTAGNSCLPVKPAAWRALWSHLHHTLLPCKLKTRIAGSIYSSPILPMALTAITVMAALCARNASRV